MAQTPSRVKRPRRDLADVHGVARGAAPSAWRTHKKKTLADGEPGLTLRSRLKLLGSNIIAWASNYARYIFRRRYRPFPTYENLESRPPGPPGIIKMESSGRRGRSRVKVALAGDWGSGTKSAELVAKKISGFEPDYTIHLGDVYYCGTEKEFAKYFTPWWPKGKKGTFALNANHEMYSGGRGYFNAIRDSKGLSYKVKGVRKPIPQSVSYFCLENEYWRILAVDTGYLARTFPFLELLDKRLVKLHPAIETWLEEVVFKDPDDHRPVILLSHHEWFSAFDSEYQRMGNQLAPYLDRVLLWFWGHEHRFSGYAPFSLKEGGPKVRGRGIGHGGIPFDIDYPDRHRNLVFSDERICAQSTNDIDARKQLGYCGFAFLEFAGPKLTVSYYDEKKGTGSLLKETWIWNSKSGKAQGKVEGGSELAKYQDGDPGVSPRRVDGKDGEKRLKALVGKWPGP